MRRAAPAPEPARRSLFALLGSALVVALWLPTTRVPIYGDDIIWSTTWYRNFGGSAARSLTTAWISDLQENRFNPVGRWFALNYHFFAYDLSATLHVDIHWYYRIGALILIWTAIVAAAYALREGLRFIHPENRIGLWTLFAIIAAGMAILVQLHPKSHDPHLTITEIGYGTEILSFLLLGLAFRAGRTDVSVASAVVPIALVTLAGVFFYETFISAVMGAGIVYVVLLVRAMRAKEPTRKPLLLLAFGVVIPAVAFLLGRWLVQFLPGVAEYSGTEFVFRLRSLLVFAYLLGGAAPGAGWPDAARSADGIGLTAESLVMAAAIIVLVVLLVLLIRRTGLPRLTCTSLAWVVAAAVATHLVVTLAMQAIARKYVEEITYLGAVYISYGGTLLALLILAFLLVLRVRRIPVKALMISLPLLGGFVVFQQAVNWTVADAFADEYGSNRTITAAIVRADLTHDERCRIFTTWRELWGNIPVENDMRDGMQWGYEHKFGEPFCAR